MNSQTYSRLFELELSPILEDVHVVDGRFGPAVSAKRGQANLTLDYDSETSDSSLGSLLEVQIVGSAKATGLGSVQTSIQTSNVNTSAGRGECRHEPLIPALTLTSPTPETLQSVVFSDMHPSDVCEDQGRSVSVSAERLGRLESASTVPRRRDVRQQTGDRRHLVIPVKDERVNAVGRRRAGAPKTYRGKPRIWIRAWKRLSHLLVLPQAALTSCAATSLSEPVRRGRAKTVENQNLGTSTPFGDATTDGYASELSDIEASSSFNGNVTGISSRRRLSFGIPTLARRRLAKRHDGSGRYTVAF